MNLNYENHNCDNNAKALLEEIMQKIFSEEIPNWRADGGYYVPKSIDTVCGFCSSVSNLVTSKARAHEPTSTVMMIGRCVRCSQESKVWVVGAKKANPNDISDTKDTQKFDDSQEVWVSPKAPLREVVIEDQNAPPRIFNAYKEAISCFNNGHWRATVTECARVLEGITKEKFPKAKEKETLYSTLQNLKSNLEKQTSYLPLFEPILQLGNSLRLGRNASAYFDLEKDPDKEVAEEVLNLVEYIVIYFYVLPQKAIDLETKIEALGSGEVNESDLISSSDNQTL